MDSSDRTTPASRARVGSLARTGAFGFQGPGHRSISQVGELGVRRIQKKRKDQYEVHKINRIHSCRELGQPREFRKNSGQGDADEREQEKPIEVSARRAFDGSRTL